MLDQNDLSLRQLVGWLTTPARCGVYLSVADIARIGAPLSVSIAPISRRAAVEQLFRAAAIDERVPELFAALADEFAAQRDAYLACDSPHLEPWVARSAEGRATIQALAESWQAGFGTST